MSDLPVQFRDLAAMKTAQRPIGEHTSQVHYQSGGHCLLIGMSEDVIDAMPALGNLRVSLAIVEPDRQQTERQLLETGQTVFRLPHLQLSGYLGAFGAPELDDRMFDLVIDMSDPPLIDRAVLPFGYRRARNEAQLAEVAAEFTELVGEFEKPRYFDYRADLCAHSRSGLDGCNRCLEACATGAITASGDGIEVNPHLCQGCGSCATVCPAGAISYSWPRVDDAINRTRKALAEAKASTLLLFAEQHTDRVEAVDWPDSVLPLAVEEVTAFGLDFWLSLLASGTRNIWIADIDDNDQQGRAALGQAQTVLGELLGGLGATENPVQLATLECLQERALAHDDNSGFSMPSPQNFQPQEGKRENLRLALDALSAHIAPTSPVTPLTAPAPFGQVNVDSSGCTLCMACVSVCPAGALLDGQDTPALRFIEANCLQCGLCEAACPESVISLTAQYTWNSVEARQSRTLNEDAPFHCVSCHKPFATSAIIGRMLSGLSEHWMYTDERAQRRLKMCGDCRVKDIFEADRAGIEVHKKPS